MRALLVVGLLGSFAVLGGAWAAEEPGRRRWLPRAIVLAVAGAASALLVRADPAAGYGLGSGVAVAVGIAGGGWRVALLAPGLYFAAIAALGAIDATEGDPAAVWILLLGAPFAFAAVAALLAAGAGLRVMARRRRPG